jgi:hypothetical protein
VQGKEVRSEVWGLGCRCFPSALSAVDSPPLIKKTAEDAGDAEDCSSQLPQLSYRSGNARPTIIKPMARGWESKSVEDQIGEAEAKKDVRRKRRLTPEETEHLQRKEALMHERARILREMERAYMRRHLVMLERGLAHIDAELAKLELEKSR